MRVELEGDGTFIQAILQVLHAFEILVCRSPIRTESP